jgi:hypothetical protein
MFRRTVWEEVGGFDEELQGYEDWNFWIDVGQLGHTMERIPRPLLHYRYSNDGRCARALPHDLNLRAQIILRHPRIYDATAQKVAKRILSGESVSQNELEKAHPIFTKHVGPRVRSYRARASSTEGSEPARVEPEQ